MSGEDYYSILGISKSANDDEVKKAYRKQAMKYHPDRNKGDKGAEEKFKKINEAYDTLKDKGKRGQYDRYGHQRYNSGGGGGGSGGAGNEQDLSDLFGDLFGDFMGTGRKSQSRSSAQSGADLRYDVSISLEDAFYGTKHTVKYAAPAKCDACSGSGGKDGSSSVIQCMGCNGSGRIREQQGFFIVEKSCSKCSGSGTIIKDPCIACRGEGRVRKGKTLNVSIPAGVDDESRIRIAGEGEGGLRGGSDGDLYVFVSIKKHRLYEREGNNLFCNIPIKMTTAALGGSIEIPGIDNKLVKIDIPEGVQNGQQTKIRGQGMSIIKSGSRGDLYVTVQVETPTNLTEEQKSLLQKFEKGATRSSSPKSEGFISKMKSFWSETTGEK